jgi:choline-sulfatase
MKHTILLLLSISVFAESAPNIVFFFADDQTTSTIGCYGNDVVQTPNIDALAARGIRFENAFVSHSICWVSRTTILSGLTGRSYGVPGNHDQARPEAVATLYTDILRDQGYRTGFFGKWHAKMPKGWKREAHFDVFEAIGRNPFYKPQPDGSLRHETELIVDRGIDFIRQQPKGKPFALNMWFNACHAEDGDRRPGIGHFAWPRAVDGMYADIEIAPPALNAPAIFDALPDFLQTTINRERYFWRWNTPEKYQTNIRAYYRMVSGIDGAIARFVDALEEAGLTDNTIIVYTADNGYHMANRGLAGKWSHYEESLRVPLIIADPRIPKAQQGIVTEAIALNLDLPSTFLDWAGATIPERYQGRSLRPIVAGQQPADWRRESFHEHFAVRHRIPAFEGLRNSQFKYVRYIDHGGYEFLHDLENDPQELVNLANSPEHKEVLEAMRARTDARVAELGGPLAAPARPFTASTVPYPESSAMVGARADESGFVRIFDGRSLRDWDGDNRYWRVKNGAITGTADDSLKANTYLTWKASTVRNFDLRMQVQISAQGNSGIQYRSRMLPELGLRRVAGYQCDVVADHADFDGMLYEAQGRNILSRAGERVIVDDKGMSWVTGKLPVQAAPSGQWHEYRILVRGNHHQHWIDGRQTADLIDFDPKGRRLEGLIGMQLHVGPAMTVQYKDIRIKHLPDDMPLLKPADHPIPADAYGVRPLGKLPPNWRAPLYSEMEK